MGELRIGTTTSRMTNGRPMDNPWMTHGRVLENNRWPIGDPWVSAINGWPHKRRMVGTENHILLKKTDVVYIAGMNTVFKRIDAFWRTVKDHPWYNPDRPISDTRDTLNTHG